MSRKKVAKRTKGNSQIVPANSEPVHDLAEILAGPAPLDRAGLHAMLDVVLDASEQDGPAVAVRLFWTFVGNLAEGRGVDDEIAQAATISLVRPGGIAFNPDGTPVDARAFWRAWQAAVLNVILVRLTQADEAAPSGAILPWGFNPAALRAVMLNLMTGPNGGPHVDWFGTETQAGSHSKTMRRVARGLLGNLIQSRASRSGRPVAAERREALPDLPDRTWKDWLRESGRPGAPCMGGIGLILTDEEVSRLFRIGWQPNG